MRQEVILAKPASSNVVDLVMPRRRDAALRFQPTDTRHNLLEVRPIRSPQFREEVFFFVCVAAEPRGENTLGSLHCLTASRVQRPSYALCRHSEQHSQESLNTAMTIRSAGRSGSQSCSLEWLQSKSASYPSLLPKHLSSPQSVSHYSPTTSEY